MCLSFVKRFEACADAAALEVSGMVECVRQRERFVKTKALLSI